MTLDNEAQAAKVNDLNNEIKKFQIEANELKKELKELKDQMTCKICLVNDTDIVLLPCGHFFCCTSCSTLLEKCGVCREVIQQRAKVYMS